MMDGFGMFFSQLHQLLFEFLSGGDGKNDG
jgi:hypothetical protein